ncbi:MAG: RHS repeat-associated core domain-containing protein [Patescibacteria group bacterium]
MKIFVVILCLVVSSLSFARYYDPQTARFLTKDPLGPHEGGDINPYRYAGNNPVNFTDPTGLKLWYADSQSQTDLGSAVQTMMQSAAGRRLLAQLHNSDNVYYIHSSAAPNGDLAAAEVGGRNAWVVPTFHPVIGTDKGPQTASTARVLAHELGHLTGVGDTPVSGNRMDNVNAWENPIMQPIDGYTRTMYGDPNAGNGNYGGSGRACR